MAKVTRSQVMKGINIFISDRELKELGEEMISTPGLAIKPSTPLEKLAVKIVAEMDKLNARTGK